MQHSRRNTRPVPEAIPLDIHHQKLLNGSLSAKELEPLDPKENNRGIFFVADEGEFYSDLETVEAASIKACENEHFRKDVQMGLDILNKIRQIFNWNTSSNHYDSGHQEGKRKRR